MDDNPAIHRDFRKIFASNEDSSELDALEETLFGARTTQQTAAVDLVFANQGAEGLVLAERALADGQAFDVAFVDVRMPPGIDGIETAARLWRLDRSLQIVICTAYSDYSWEEISERLGSADSYLILKKPFDRIEARQLVQSLSEKRALLRERELRLQQLDLLIRERTAELARANASLALEMTQRLQTEQHLHQLQKLEALGRLAACMGHEINNPLSYVLANVEQASVMVADSTPIGPAERKELHEMLQEAVNGVHRIAVLVRHLKVFSRAQPLPTRRYLIGDVIESALTLAGNEIRHKAMLTLNVGADLPALVGEPERIEQVLVNLLLNAVQAFPLGDPANNSIRVTASQAADGDVIVEVRDNGCGIAPEDIERVFEAFFTTKPVGEGTGLGLAISHSIVQAHGGSMSIESALGAGTTVTVVLPVAVAAAAASG